MSNKTKRRQAKALEQRNDFLRRSAITSVILGFIIGALFRLSICFAYDEDWSTFITQPVSTMLIILGGIVIAGGLIFLFFRQNMDRNAEGESEESIKFALMTAGIIFACWIPYIVIRWPGYCISDTVDQISQVLFPDNVYTAQGLHLIDENVKLNQHHPVFTTFIYAFFYRFGANLGHPNLGMGLLTTLQCMAISFGMGKMLSFMKTRNISKKYITGCLLFFALAPVHPNCSTFLAKDGIFVIFFIFAQLALVRICENTSLMEDKKALARLGVWTLLCMLTRHNPIYVGILMAVMFIIVYRKKAIKPAATLALCACMVLCLNNVILPAFSVTKSDSDSMFSVPLITLARASIEHGGEFSREDIAGITTFMTKDGYSYNPTLADGITSAINRDATTKDKITFLKTWAKIGLRYPGCYAKALMWFWSPMYSSRYETADFEWIPTDIGYGTWYPLPTGKMSALGIHNSKYMIRHCGGFMYVQNAIFGRTWPLNLPYGCDLYFWSIIIMLAFLRLKRQLKNNICMFSMCLFTMLTVLAGPITYIRYIYPIATVVPLLLAMTVFRAERRAI